MGVLPVSQNQGSKFFFELPLHSGAASAGESNWPPRVSDHNPSRSSFLVVPTSISAAAESLPLLMMNAAPQAPLFARARSPASIDISLNSGGKKSTRRTAFLSGTDTDIWRGAGPLFPDTTNEVTEETSLSNKGDSSEPENEVALFMRAARSHHQDNDMEFHDGSSIFNQDYLMVEDSSTTIDKPMTALQQKACISERGNCT